MHSRLHFDVNDILSSPLHSPVAKQ